MQLKTLGGLALEPSDFYRPKTLLLLAYLAVEGAKEKRHLYELFWPEATDPANSLRSVGKVLRKLGPELLSNDEQTVSTSVQSDIAALQTALSNQDGEKVAELYKGAFLAELSLPDWGAELEEWVYSTREFVAARVRSAFIQAAEVEAAKGRFVEAAGWAEKAHGLGKEEAEAEELERLYPLLLAGSSALAVGVRKQAREYGLELSLSKEEAQQRYFTPTLEGSPEPQAIPHNLPRSKTSFIGRDPELIELGQMLSQSEVRLITLLGPGGIGKTRVGLQLAGNQLREDQFKHGIYFVALEALSEASQIPLALAQTLGIPFKNDPMAAVKAALANKQMLLVLDNYEHLMDGALVVSQLLEACPNLRVVVTSRERLNLEEEFVLLLEGLPLPQVDHLKLAEAEYNDALKLFVQRAKRTKSDFALTSETLPHVLSICKFVEGSPLGIELSAVWLRSLSIADLASEIGQIVAGLEAPTRNLSERHQSLRAVFEHSWKLLKPKEQLTLARLTVFADGFSREAASQVSGATIPLLTSLVDKSLLRISPEGRYDFHPLLHQYAAEKLAEGREEKTQSRTRHLEYFLSLIEASRNAGTKAQIKCSREEYQNLLSALAWTQESNQALLGLRMADALAAYWLFQVYYGEGSQWLATVLAHPGAAAPSKERTEALLSAILIATKHSAHAQAMDYGQEALRIAQTLGEEELTARALLMLGSELDYRGDLQSSKKYNEAALALAQKLGHDELVARALHHLAIIANKSGDTKRALELYKQSLERFRKLGAWLRIAGNLNNLGFALWCEGDLKAARAYLEEGVAIPRDLVDLQVASTTQNNLSAVLLDLGELSPALVWARRALEFRFEHGDRFGLVRSLENFGFIAAVQGNARRAACLWGVAERVRGEIKLPMPSNLRIQYERFVTRAKSLVDEESFSAAWQEGTAMSLEEAVRYALEGSEEVPTAILQK